MAKEVKWATALLTRGPGGAGGCQILGISAVEPAEDQKLDGARIFIPSGGSEAMLSDLSRVAAMVVLVMWPDLDVVDREPDEEDAMAMGLAFRQAAAAANARTKATTARQASFTCVTGNDTKH